MQHFAALLSLLLLSSNGSATPLEKRDTVGCYNTGYGMSRASLASAIDRFCDDVGVSGLQQNNNQERTYEFSQGHRVIVGAYAKQCSAIDQNLQCKIVLRRAVDECNTSSTEGKQGGTVDTDCVQWRVDPEW